MSKKKPKILIAPNSYKESADSVTVAEYFYDYLKELDADFIVCPLSDGGDGFLKVIDYKKKLQILNYNVCAPWKYFSENSLSETLTVPAGYSPEDKTVYIESADIFGMKIIPPEKRKPMHLTTEGLGELLLMLEKDHLNNTVEIVKVVIGIGGTGTTDGGAGILSALGMQLTDEQNNLLTIIPDNFNKAVHALFAGHTFPFEIELVQDVSNELFGDRGGIKTYSLQKGIEAEELEDLEQGIKNILDMLNAKKLSGAGGGIASGMSLLTGVQTVLSTEFLEKEFNLEKLIEQSDIIITGEGRFDYQSSFNKAAGIILQYEKRKPVFLCCGEIKIQELPANIIPVSFTDFFISQKESIKNIKEAVKQTSLRILDFIHLHTAL